MPTLLCIDTSSASCSVALLHSGDVLLEVENTPQKHSERVLEMCESLLNSTNIDINEVDALGISQGPGSFTGVRIGISVAQGIAFAANIPVIAVSSLALLAQQTYRQYNDEKVLCLSDARMGEMYWGAFTLQNGLMTNTENEGLIAPADFSFENVMNKKSAGTQDWVSCGSAWPEYETQLSTLKNQFKSVYTDIALSAENIIPFAIHGLETKNTISAFQLEPVYLRNKVAEKVSERKAKTK